MFKENKDREVTGSETGIPAAPALNRASRKEIVTDLAVKLTSDYAITETGLKMADSLRNKLESGGYNSVTSPFDYARILTEGLSAVAHDRHLRVVYSSQPLRSASSKPPSADMIEKQKE